MDNMYDGEVPDWIWYMKMDTLYRHGWEASAVVSV